MRRWVRYPGCVCDNRILQKCHPAQQPNVSFMRKRCRCDIHRLGIRIHTNAYIYYIGLTLLALSSHQQMPQPNMPLERPADERRRLRRRQLAAMLAIPTCQCHEPHYTRIPSSCIFRHWPGRKIRKIALLTRFVIGVIVYRLFLSAQRPFQRRRH